MRRCRKNLDRFTKIEDEKRTFAAMMSAKDDAVGRVLAKVRETGQEENTLIFLLADNGGPTMRPRRTTCPCGASKPPRSKGACGCRSASSGSKLPAGKVYDPPVIQLDILPTAITAAGGRLT